MHAAATGDFMWRCANTAQLRVPDVWKVAQHADLMGLKARLIVLSSSRSWQMNDQSASLVLASRVTSLPYQEDTGYAPWMSFTR